MAKDLTEPYVKEFRKRKTYSDVLGLCAALGKLPVGVDPGDPGVQKVVQKAREINKKFLRRVHRREKAN